MIFWAFASLMPGNSIRVFLLAVFRSISVGLVYLEAEGTEVLGVVPLATWLPDWANVEVTAKITKNRTDRLCFMRLIANLQAGIVRDILKLCPIPISLAKSTKYCVRS